MELLSGKPATQHLVEMRANREAWARKPLLQAIYGQFYRRIRDHLARMPGPAAELGSGIGAIKEFIPECITSRALFESHTGEEVFGAMVICDTVRQT